MSAHRNNSTVATPSVIEATVTYVLSEATGGRRTTRVRVAVPSSDLDVVHVDNGGHASLLLVPRYERVDSGYVKIDEPPVYDQVPSVGQLLADARAAFVSRQQFYELRKDQRRADDAARKAKRAALARAFLDNPSARAVTEPPPMLRVCWLMDDVGERVCFRHTDPAPGNRVPPEARRRYHEDIQARRAARTEHGQARLQQQQSVGQARETVIRQWVLANGTDDQRQRLEAGVLPWNEVVRELEAEAWAQIARYPLYRPITAQDLQTRLHADPEWTHVTVRPTDIHIEQTTPDTLTPRQSSALLDIRHSLPDATVVLRRDEATWANDPSGRAPTLVRYALRVTRRVGPFSFKRIVDPGE